MLLSNTSISLKAASTVRRYVDRLLSSVSRVLSTVRVRCPVSSSVCNMAALDLKYTSGEITSSDKEVLLVFNPPVSEILGKKSLRAMSSPATVLRSCASACTRSGLRSSSSEGNPGCT